MHKNISKALRHHLSQYVPTVEIPNDIPYPYGTLHLHTMTHDNKLPHPFQIQIWSGTWHIFQSHDGIPHVKEVFDLTDTTKGYLKFDTPTLHHIKDRIGQVLYNYVITLTCKIKESIE